MQQEQQHRRDRAMSRVIFFHTFSSSLFLLFAIFAALSSLALFALPAHAGGPPTTAPLTPSGRIYYAQIVHRHGDRTVIHPMPSAARLWNEPDAPPPGSLTQRGFAQTRALGELLATRYVGTIDAQRLFDTRSFLEGTIYVRSTDVPRCMQSAESMLDGFLGVGRDVALTEADLLSPSSFSLPSSSLSPFSAWTRPPIHVVPCPTDMLLQSTDKCASYSLSFVRYAANADAIVTRNQALFDLVQRESGWFVGVNTSHAPSYLLYNVLDNLHCERAHGLASRSSVVLHKKYKQLLRLAQEMLMPLYSPVGPRFSLSAYLEPPQSAAAPAGASPSSSSSSSSSTASSPTFPYMRDSLTDLDPRGTIGATLLLDLVHNAIDKVLAVARAESSSSSTTADSTTLSLSQDVLNRATLATQRGLDVERLRLYSAHDTTLMALFSALSLLTKDSDPAYVFPPYASAFTLELHRDKTHPLEWFVSLRYGRPTQSHTASDTDDNVVTYRDDGGNVRDGSIEAVRNGAASNGGGGGGGNGDNSGGNSGNSTATAGNPNTLTSRIQLARQRWEMVDSSLFFWCADALLTGEPLHNRNSWERATEFKDWAERGVHKAYSCSLAGFAAFSMMLNRPSVWGDATHAIPRFREDSLLRTSSTADASAEQLASARVELLEWLARVPLPNTSSTAKQPRPDTTYGRDDGCCLRSNDFETQCPSTRAYASLAPECRVFRRMCPWTACEQGWVLHAGSLNCVRVKEEELVEAEAGGDGELGGGGGVAPGLFVEQAEGVKEDAELGAQQQQQQSASVMVFGLSASAWLALIVFAATGYLVVRSGVCSRSRMHVNYSKVMDDGEGAGGDSSGSGNGSAHARNSSELVMLRSSEST